MKGIVYIEKRKLPPSKNHKKGRTRFYVNSEVDGEKRSHGGHNTERAAKDKRRELLKQISEGTFGKAEKQDLVFKDYYEDWWTRKKTELGSGTIIAYQNSYEGYIGPFFNDMKLRDITPEVVQQFVDSINNLAPGYSRTIYGHFRSCINSAAYLEIMSKSPCTKGISLPPVPREIKKYFGPADLWRIIDESYNPYKALFAILAFSGMRIGECLALRWKNVDFESGRIRVDQTWDSRGMGGLHPPKTESSMRSVEMISVLAEILQDFVGELGSVDPEDFLFPAPKDPNRPRSYTSVLRVYKSTLKKLGLDYHNIHSLRHSFASMAISAGLSIATITRNPAEYASPAITLRLYAHVIEETVGPALEKVDALFRDAGKRV